MRIFFLALALAVVASLALFGWRGHHFSQPPIQIFPDMVRQSKVKPQTPDHFFADGLGARRPVPGTVPLGYEMPAAGSPSPSPAGGPYLDLRFSSGSSYAATGRIDGQWGSGLPWPVTASMMDRGRERFGIYCAMCHGETGAGDGMARKFGLNTVQSLLQDRIRAMPDGEIFHTVTNGKNTMIGLGDRIPAPDRWAIIAYLRALQKSQGGSTLQDVPEPERSKLEGSP